MNEEESQYDDLRWLARDARAERSRTVRRTAYWATAAAVLTTAFVATQQMTFDTSVEHDEIVRRLAEIERLLDELADPEPTTINLDSIEQTLTSIAAIVDRLDASGTSRETIAGSLNTLMIRLGDLTASRGAMVTTNTNWLQIMADGPAQGQWRLYPMLTGDSLWIPDGNFFATLMSRSITEVDTIFMDVYLAGTETSGIAWPLELPATRPTLAKVPKDPLVPDGDQYYVKLFYARSSSQRPGFIGRGFVDIAICWSDTSEETCPDELPAEFR